MRSLLPRGRRGLLVTLAGAVAALVLLVVIGTLRGGGGVAVDAPHASAGVRRACAALTAALPERVGGRERVAVDDARRGAAWGDPATVLTCGVGVPADYDRFGMCQETDGLGWYVPRDQVEDQSADVTMTTIGRYPRVEVRVPARFRPPADVMVDLATAVKAHTTRVGRCR